MQHTLIIVAHPKTDSFSFAMANAYRENVQRKGREVEMLDLYRETRQQPFFAFDDQNDMTATEEMTYFQHKIAEADEIVLVFPFWWGSFPAILKNFIDWNLSKGFAFTYVDGRPKGLLQGKSVRVFTTSGAPKLIYTLTGAYRRLKYMIKHQIVVFCGMELAGFHAFGGIDTSAKNTKKILDEIRSL